MSPYETPAHFNGYLNSRYLVICHPMKAKYISTPGRAKKIIATIWVVAISLNSVAASFINGVSNLQSGSVITKTKLLLKFNKGLLF